MDCQICGGKGSETFVKNGFAILRCINCNHYFVDLKITTEKVYEIYSDSYFYGGGEGYPDYLLEEEMLIKRGEYYAKKISRFIRSGRILDVGAAAGCILKGFENMGWHGVGIEPNAKMVEYGKRSLKIDLRQGTLETARMDSKFDLIVMIQVIAHLADLNRSILNVSDLLDAHGFVLIETWNRCSLTAKLFGKNWHEYSPPSTLNFFNKRTLDALLERYNFKKISSGRPQKKIISNHAKSLIKHKMGNTRLLKYFSGVVNLIPDNVYIPYPAEESFWALYQKKNTPC